MQLLELNLNNYLNIDSFSPCQIIGNLWSLHKSIKVAILSKTLNILIKIWQFWMILRSLQIWAVSPGINIKYFKIIINILHSQRNTLIEYSLLIQTPYLNSNITLIHKIINNPKWLLSHSILINHVSLIFHKILNNANNVRNNIFYIKVNAILN